MADPVAKIMAELQLLRGKRDAWKKTDADLEDLKRQHACVSAAKELLEKNVADLTRQLDETLASENERLQAKLQEDLAAEQERNQAAIDDLVKSHEDKLAEVLAAKSDRHKSKLEAIRVANKTERKDLKKQHEGNLLKQADEHKSALETQQQLHLAELEAAETSHQVNIEELIANHAQEMLKLTEQLEAERNQREESRKAMERLLGMAQCLNSEDSQVTTGDSLLGAGVTADGTGANSERKSFFSSVTEASPKKIQSVDVETSTDVPYDAESRQLQGEKEKLEKKLERMHEEKQNQRQQIQKLQDQTNSDRQSHEKVTAECEELRLKVDRLETELQSGQESLKNYKSNNESQLKLIQLECDAKTENLLAAQEKLDQAERSLREFENACENLSQESAKLQQKVTSAETDAAAVRRELGESQRMVQQWLTENRNLSDRCNSQAQEFDKKLQEQNRKYNHLYTNFCEQSENLRKAEHRRTAVEQEMEKQQHELTGCKENLAKLQQQLKDLQVSQRQAADQAQAEEREKVKAQEEKNQLLEAAHQLRQFIESEKKKVGEFQAENNRLRQESERVRRELEGKLQGRERELQDMNTRLTEAQWKLNESADKMRQLEQTNQRSLQALTDLKAAFENERAEKDQLRVKCQQRQDSVNQQIIMITDLQNQIDQLQRQQQRQSQQPPQQQQQLLQDHLQQSLPLNSSDFFQKHNKHNK